MAPRTPSLPARDPRLSSPRSRSRAPRGPRGHSALFHFSPPEGAIVPSGGAASPPFPAARRSVAPAQARPSGGCGPPEGPGRGWGPGGSGPRGPRGGGAGAALGPIRTRRFQEAPSASRSAPCGAALRAGGPEGARAAGSGQGAMCADVRRCAPLCTERRAARRSRSRASLPGSACGSIPRSLLEITLLSWRCGAVRGARTLVPCRRAPAGARSRGKLSAVPCWQ